MSNDKKIWLCEQYAQKAWTLSLSFAQEAGRIGHFGRGYAVVADETRTLANKLFEYTCKAKFDNTSANDFKGIVDFAFHIGLLSINATVEILRVNPMVTDMAINKSMAVLAEDLSNLALEINALTDAQVWRKPSVLPEIVSPLKSTYTIDFFFRFSIGGIPFVENTANIVEIHSGQPVDGDTFNLRSMEIPTINCYQHFSLSHVGFNENEQTFMIIQPGGAGITSISAQDMYAVPIDDLDINTIFQSKIGCAVPPKDNHVFAKYSRECWDAVGGGQLIFIDWEKLIGK